MLISRVIVLSVCLLCSSNWVVLCDCHVDVKEIHDTGRFLFCPICKCFVGIIPASSQPVLPILPSLTFCSGHHGKIVHLQYEDHPNKCVKWSQTAVTICDYMGNQQRFDSSVKPVLQTIDNNFRKIPAG